MSEVVNWGGGIRELGDCLVGKYDILGAVLGGEMVRFWVDGFITN